MIKIFFVMALSIFLLNAASPKELFNKIKESKNSLSVTKKQKVYANSKLESIAKKIDKLNNEILINDKKLSELDSYLSTQEKKYSESMSELKGIDNMVGELDKDIESKKRDFAQMLSKQLGSVVAQNRTSQKSEKSVVLKEVYSRYKDYSQQELLKLSKNIEQKRALRGNLIKRKEDINSDIKDTKLKKKIYKKEKLEKKKLLDKLANQEKLYSNKLKKIFKKQTVIRLTLAKLNILRDDSAKAAKKRELELRRRIRALKKIKFADRKRHKVSSASRVKQYSGSYSSKNIYKYRGAKTISPVKSPKVIKRFGTYIDPIYKIKTHSDSLVIVSRSRDNRVYNVLNGEVVFKGKNAMLGKMVIVKHRNGIYTIYADLNKFSPFIKVGSKVKKGIVIGKVKRKLIFQATKDGAFINPARLVKI